jgi:RNA polymerase sigma factor (sigma-70 family)
MPTPVITPGSEKITQPKPEAEPEIYEDPVPEETVLEAQAGDVRARNRVLLAFMPIIRRIVRHYHGPSPEEQEDMTTEGILALYQAIGKWGPEKQARVKFAPYAVKYIKATVGRYLNAVRGIGRGGKREKTKMVYLDKPDVQESGSERGYHLPSSEPTPEEEVAQRKETWRSTLMDYIKKMPGRYGELLRARYIEQLKYAEMAQQFGVSEHTLAAWVRLALEKVKHDLPELQEAWKEFVESERGRLPRQPGSIEPVGLRPYPKRAPKRPGAD